MKKLIVITACVAALLLAPAAYADQHWTSLSLGVVEKVDGELAPQPRATLINYINGKGIGVHLGEDAMGPVASILMWEHANLKWLKGASAAMYFQGSADLLNAPEGSTSKLHTGLMGPDFRLGYGSLGDVELSFAPLWRFREGQKAEFFPTFSLVFRTK